MDGTIGRPHVSKVPARPYTAGALSNPSIPALSLRASAVWTLGGQLGYAAAQWAMVALLARAGNAGDVGHYALGLALTAPLFLLLGLGLRSVQATDAAARYPFAQYFSLRAVLMLAGLPLTALLAALYPQAAWVIVWLGVAKALEGVSEVAYGLMQREHRLDIVARSMLLRGALGLGLLGGLFVLTGSVAWGAFGVALAALLTLAHDLPPARRLAPGSWRAAALDPRLPRLALPLGLVAALVSLGITVPRLFVERELGAAPLGVYSALSYPVIAGGMVVVALGTALTTRLALAFEGAPRHFVRLAALLTLAGGGLGLGFTALAALAGEPLLALLYGPEYAAHAQLFVWLTLGGAAGYLASAAGFAMTAARRFAEQLPLFVAVVGASALACALLIPRFGLLGAAYAALLAAGVQLLGSGLVVFLALRARAVSSAP